MQIISIFIIFNTFLATPTTSSAPVSWNCTNSAGNFTETSPFNASLSNAFSKLVTMSSSMPFSNVTVGSIESDRVYALFSCQRDLPLHICLSCVENATKDIVGLCYPSPKEAIITYKVLSQSFSLYLYI